MTVKINWRKQYDYERDEIERENTDIDNFEPTQTIEDPESDINVLMQRMGITDGSILPGQMGVSDPRFYGDFTDMPDLKEALDRTHHAEELFTQLPAKIRERFLNNPWKLNEWINNPENWDEAVKIGLLQQKPEEPKTPPETPPKE